MARLFGLGGKAKKFEFRCKDCGKMHRGSPSISHDKPIQYFYVPEHERETRVTITKDLCSILPSSDEPSDKTDYFIRATLDVPIHDALEPFCWGVWVTQSENSFRRYAETFGHDQSGDGSFGWLTVTMKYYSRTATDEPLANLECNVEWGLPRERPKIRLKECDHPLYIDQRDGISWDKAIEIARVTLHGKL